MDEQIPVHHHRPRQFTILKPRWWLLGFTGFSIGRFCFCCITIKTKANTEINTNYSFTVSFILKLSQISRDEAINKVRLETEEGLKGTFSIFSQFRHKFKSFFLFIVVVTLSTESFVVISYVQKSSLTPSLSKSSNPSTLSAKTFSATWC